MLSLVSWVTVLAVASLCEMFQLVCVGSVFASVVVSGRRNENTTFVPSGDTSRSRTAPIPLVIGKVTLTSGLEALAASRTYRSLPVMEVMRSSTLMSAGVAALSFLFVFAASTGCLTYAIG